jgi:hypothetical protein
VSLAISVDRFDYVSGSWLFWSEHHSDQFSDGYAKLSRYQFDPGACFTGWSALTEAAQDVYRAWCRKEGEPCTYDHLRYILETADCFDFEDACVEYFLERYGDETLEDTGLVNYDHSDFVNNDMCYTRDLLRFYDRNEDEVKHWFSEMCEAYCYTSTLQALEGETIEDPDDMKAAMVNGAMTFLARQMLDTVSPDR